MSKTDSTRWLDWRVDEDGRSIRPVKRCRCGREFTPSDPEQDTCRPCIQEHKLSVVAHLDKKAADFEAEQMAAYEELERIRIEARREGLA